MNIDQDSVPSTILAAVQSIAASVTEEEREWICAIDRPDSRVHHTIGRHIRNNWSLWSPDSPLKRDAIAVYRIAHADDISGLILAWACALIRGDTFDPQAECERFHKHWAQFGMTSLEAGGM